MDAGGNVYATAFYNHTILKVSPTGSVTVLAGLAPTSGRTDGVGSTARFTNPRALALDASGNLYVADTGNHAIRKVTPAGVVTTFAGQMGSPGWDDGTGSVARFDAPQGVAVDTSGNVYVADTGSRTIRKITPAGVVTTLAGLGYVAGATNGTGLDARFDSPQGIAAAANGDVYVADTNNHAIRKISSAGVTTTVAGSLGNRGNLDGTGTDARFDSPQAVAIDTSGTLFVADTNNYLIRKVTAAGVVTTIGGAGASGDSPGIGTAARFNQTRGIALGADGSLYIADSYGLKLGSSSSQLAITVQPISQSVAAGSAARFGITATGAPPLNYQWQKNGSSIAGATNASLVLPAVQSSDAATYTVTVSNSVGTLASTGGTLTVLAPVPNDNFANAQVLAAASGSLSGNNNGATGEPGEPTHVVFTATASSVWYKWTATETGTAVFNITSSSFSPAIGIWTGSSVTALTRVVTGFNRVSFRVQSGTSYYLAVGSPNSSGRGNFNVTWRTIPNDDFANAQVLAGNNGSAAGNNEGATGEPGEPGPFGPTSSSVWYRWTPSQDGVARFAFESSSSQLIWIFAGDSLSTLTGVTPMDTGGGRFYFVARAGTTYTIGVGNSGYSSGAFTLNWMLTAGPVVVPLGFGQATASATLPVSVTSSIAVQAMVGTPVTLSVRPLSATPVTIQWQRDGIVLPAGLGSPFTIANAQPSDTGSYAAVVTNSSGSTTSNAVTVTIISPPANDNFAAAAALTGNNGTIAGTNVNATGETGEPVHWSLAGTASSVWYKWTAPAIGLAAIDTVGSTFDTVLAVYTGSSLANLTRLTQDDDRGGGRTSLVNFAATSGTTYYIAVGGSYASARGNVTLNWQLSPTLAVTVPPANQTVAIGGSATFSVTAAGSGVTYQWNRNGTPIPGATSATLTVANVQGGSDATYTATITNSNGSVTSAPATLAVAAPALTQLSLRNVRPGGSLLWGLAANGNTLVAVGNGGAIISSDDNGNTWTPRISGTTAWLVGVTYGAGQFIAVGDAGLVLTSPDGVTWTPATSSGTTQRLNNVIFADGKFVAVGEGGTIVTSIDGRLWTPRLSGTTNWLHGLAYNAGIGHFAASGQGGVFLYSADGLTWNRLQIAGLTGDLEATVAVDSYAQFVAIGQDGIVAAVHQNRLVLKTGETLITWSGEFNNTGTSVRLRGLAQGASALFATGEDGKVITATDHRGPWYTVSSGTSGNLLAGLYHNNALFIVGENEIALQSGALFGSRLINISTRGQVGTGSNLMISGFVITGDRPKQVLVRAAGPTLAASFGVSGTLGAPVLTLVDNQNRTVGANAGWLNSPDAATITTTAARVGAFPFAANSTDSALLATLSPRAYTALISGANNTTGVSIVEVYDTETLSNQGSRAINISTRGVAGSGDTKMIAGFVINGASSRRVLIRAVGPTIGAAPFNVGGSLAEPQIELYNSRNLLHATAGAWGLQTNADEIRGTARAVGAFDLPDGSKDSAMVLTLLPGAWTVQVGGAGNSTGVVLVEVYALP